MSQKQIRFRYIILVVLLILAFALWIYTIVDGNGNLYVLLATLPIIAVAVALRFTKEKADKTGFFTNRQAAAFYTECEKNAITVDRKNEPKWRPVYNTTVGILPSDDLAKNTDQAKKVYAAGKSITERKNKIK